MPRLYKNTKLFYIRDLSIVDFTTRGGPKTNPLWIPKDDRTHSSLQIVVCVLVASGVSTITSYMSCPFWCVSLLLHWGIINVEHDCFRYFFPFFIAQKLGVFDFENLSSFKKCSMSRQWGHMYLLFP